MIKIKIRTRSSEIARGRLGLGFIHWFVSYLHLIFFSTRVASLKAQKHFYNLPADAIATVACFGR